MTNLDPQERNRRARIVIDDSDGIIPMFEAFYLQSLAYAAGRAVEAFRRFDAELIGSRNEATIVASVHEGLTHIAAVSRFFWPAGSAGPLAAARGAKLRNAFGITESSPLYDRALRNALEHFDERLDEFLLHDRVGYFFPGPLVGSASLADDQLGNIFRLVDPDTQTFVLLGEKFPFDQMRIAVQAVSRRAQEAANGRLPQP